MSIVAITLQAEMSDFKYHQDCLAKSCRVCGLFKGEKSGEYLYDCLKSDLKEKILLTFNVDIENDYSQIHPTKLCNNCYSKCYRSCDKNNVEPFSWTEHAEGCQICLHFKTKQRGGRKRKNNTGAGRPKKIASVKHSHTKIEIPQEIISSPIINTTPELARFCDPPPDLLCPICKEILHQPLQSACQHYFCHECIRTWLEHAGENGKCPVCTIPTSVKTLEKAPRLLLNILRSLLVRCSICKDPFPLEQLYEHETNCRNYNAQLSRVTLPQILQKPLTVPLDKDEEALATQLIKRKLEYSDRSHIFMKTGGTVSNLLTCLIKFIEKLFELESFAKIHGIKCTN